MNQAAKRLAAFICMLALALALVALGPAVAYAQEPDEAYEAEYEAEYEAPDAEAETDEAIADEAQYADESQEAVEGAVTGISVVTITEDTLFSFTPNATGYWTFVTSNSGNIWPRLWVINHYGHIVASDSGTAPDGNAIVKVHLVEGAPYVIRAGYDWADEVGTYTLSVFMSHVFERPMRPAPIPTEIPGEGGIVSGYDRLLYSFTPDTSGFWAFNAETDGWYLDLEIQDAHWNMIAFNMDDWATEFGAVIRMIAGVEYIIRGWVDWDAPYTLSVSPTDTFEPWVDWDLLAQWGLDMDFDADRVVIPPYGGEFVVNETTHFSFTPEATTMWFFDLLDSTADVIILVTDTYGSFLTPVEGDRWWTGWAGMYLEEGVEYVIWAGSMWSTNFSFTLAIESFDGVEEPEDPSEWIPDPEWGIEEEWGVRLPSEGGYVYIGDDFWFLFSPETTDSWTIQILASGAGWRELSIADASRSFWLNDWDGNAISMHMAAGMEYTIETWVSWETTGAMLHVSPTYQIHMPSTSTQAMRPVVRETEFSFIPNETGYWAIYTSRSVGATDPFLWLLDAEGNIIAQDDDGGAGLNAFIKVHLEAGVEYVIRAGFFAGAGEYMLTVRKAGAMPAEDEMVILVPPPVL